MKSRLTTYLLIAAVLAVWGIVAWKLLFSKPDVPATVAVKPTERTSEEPEGDFLLLNYKDPFLRNAVPPDPPEATTAEIKPAPPPKSAKPPIKPAVKYAGTIKKKGKVSYLFEHAGLLHTLAPGDELQGYILAEIYIDSVRLTKNEDEFIIHIQNPD